jgi:hypothetical protein
MFETKMSMVMGGGVAVACVAVATLVRGFYFQFFTDKHFTFDGLRFLFNMGIVAICAFVIVTIVARLMQIGL